MMGDSPRGARHLGVLDNPGNMETVSGHIHCWKAPMVHTALISRVQRNCDVSDARHAGLYSVCGLALRLRDLYKWDLGLPPWKEGAPGDVLDWIDARETLWADLEEEAYLPIEVDGNRFEPFDTRAINAALRPRGLFYGAGYAYSLKPSFLLSELDSDHHVEGEPVVRLGKELARDLLTIPAMTQDGRIVFRRDSARMYLWDQIMYIKPSGRPALNSAMCDFGLNGADPGGIREHLDALLDRMQENYLYHELGEIRDDVFDRDIWRALISEFPHSPVELLVRSVKDLLADTGPAGTLRRIARKRDCVSLGLYVAFFDGLGRDLFPELRAAYSLYVQRDNWSFIEDAVSAGYATATRLAEAICRIYRDGANRHETDRMAREIRALMPCRKTAAAKTPSAPAGSVDGHMKSE